MQAHRDEKNQRHAPPTRSLGLEQALQTDPVCEMQVPTDGALRFDFAGTTYFFCTRSCLARFQRDPLAFAGRGRIYRAMGVQDAS